MTMNDEIKKILKTVERERSVTVLLAVESGSRAWGFASPDSDYDVRFIYKKKPEFYLKLEEKRDVIELPSDGVLDVNGWDLSKTLRLLRKSNPTLFEWFRSPIIYSEDVAFADSFRRMMDRYFSAKSVLWHYIGMARGNWRNYLDSDMVRAKKYFYVLRPILACRWILKFGTPPPMLFTELLDACLDDSVRKDVDRLLVLKMENPEVRDIPRIDALNAYLNRSLFEIEEMVRALPSSHPPAWEELNEFFLKQIL